MAILHTPQQAATNCDNMFPLVSIDDAEKESMNIRWDSIQFPSNPMNDL